MSCGALHVKRDLNSAGWAAHGSRRMRGKSYFPMDPICRDRCRKCHRFYRCKPPTLQNLSQDACDSCLQPCLGACSRPAPLSRFDCSRVYGPFAHTRLDRSQSMQYLTCCCARPQDPLTWAQLDAGEVVRAWTPWTSRKLQGVRSWSAVAADADAAELRFAVHPLVVCVCACVLPCWVWAHFRVCAMVL